MRAMPISGLIATAPCPNSPVASTLAAKPCALSPAGIDSPSAVGFALEAVVRPAEAQADWEFQQVYHLRGSMSGFGVLRS